MQHAHAPSADVCRARGFSNVSIARRATRAMGAYEFRALTNYRQLVFNAPRLIASLIQSYRNVRSSRFEPAGLWKESESPRENSACERLRSHAACDLAHGRYAFTLATVHGNGNIESGRCPVEIITPGNILYPHFSPPCCERKNVNGNARSRAYYYPVTRSEDRAFVRIILMRRSCALMNNDISDNNVGSPQRERERERERTHRVRPACELAAL